MFITADLLDSSNNRIVRIIKNEFQAFPEHAFNPKQPDKHSLVVRDMEGAEIFHVIFLNPRNIRIVGRFYISGISQPLVVESSRLILPGNIVLENIVSIRPGSVIRFD
jgi:hypothetical protein